MLFYVPKCQTRLEILFLQLVACSHQCICTVFLFDTKLYRRHFLISGRCDFTGHRHLMAGCHSQLILWELRQMYQSYFLGKCTSLIFFPVCFYFLHLVAQGKHGQQWATVLHRSRGFLSHWNHSLTGSVSLSFFVLSASSTTTSAFGSVLLSCLVSWCIPNSQTPSSRNDFCQDSWKTSQVPSSLLNNLK